MKPRTFAEKIFNADAGTIVFAKPDIILSHDNTASIEKTFRKMGGTKVYDPTKLLITLDHNAPPTNSKLANDYQQIRKFVSDQGITKFHDTGDGICHQIMANYARPGMIIVGSDSHTCTAGAFNTFAAGIDRTETAGLWKQGETWFKVPQSIKIKLKGKLPDGVYAKDLALYIIGMIGADGADYMSVEFHGDCSNILSVADRMTIANLASEMGAKNAVFCYDELLSKTIGHNYDGVWSDPGAEYAKKYEINLDEIFPVVSHPHQVDNVKSVDEVAGTKIGQALIGTCTNGRIEDLRIAASILKGKKVPAGFQLLVTPASKEIYLQAMQEGLVEIFLNAGANMLSPSCGPCLGTGQGIPADGVNVISTANRNFLGRMGNEKSSVYLASPATVAASALKGEIVSLRGTAGNTKFEFQKEQVPTISISTAENRKVNNVWDYADINNLNTDQMFAGNLTYEVNSSEPEKILPHLFKGFDVKFASNLQKGDILICGENFGCGSSREHPAVGLAFAGVKAVLAKSVNRIFFRSAINQGLPIIVLPEAVSDYKRGDEVKIDMETGKITIGKDQFAFNPLPQKLLEILENGGLVNWIQSKSA